MARTADQGDTGLCSLLQATIREHVSPLAQVRSVEPLPVARGMSGVSVRRYQLALTGAADDRRLVRLVVKDAALVERRVLALLQVRGPLSVPFSHTFDLETDAAAPLCLEDLGDRRRPHSRMPIAPALLQAEAAALAAIHQANRGHTATLGWLPRADRAYFVEQIERRYWRPHWERALADADFQRAFGAYLRPVEAAAARAPAEVAELCDEGDAITVIHGDINPSNVLLVDDRPFFIDWQAACSGAFYLDLPHHFCTLEQAEVYRGALASLGWQVPRADFAERYRAAARYIGLRYLWWTLEAWREDRAEAPWVLHYLHMIVG